MARAVAVANPHDDYEALYRQHGPRVRRLCRLVLLDADEAEDVAQEVFLKLLREHRDRAGSVAWGPWLTRVAVNACRDRRRSRWWGWWRTSGEEPALDGVAERRATPEDETLDAEHRARIWAAFRRLPVRQREVFALRHVEEWSTEDTARILGVETGTVKRHLFRAVRHLRGALGDVR